VIASNQTDNPAIDGNGNVVVRTLLDISGAFGTATAANRALFLYGGPAGSATPVHLIARDGTAAYQLPNVNNWNTNSTANGVGLRATPTVTPGGVLFLAAQMNGAGATTTNNTGFWTGAAGSLAQVVQRGFVPAPGGVAPGTSGGVWASNLNIDTSGASGFRGNDAGQVIFESTLTGGDVISGTNDDGVFVGSPSGIVMVARKGQGNLQGLGDPAITSGPSPSGGTFLNHQGEVAFIGTLTLESGSVDLVSTSNNMVIYTNLGNPGGMVRVIAREGDPVPWDPSGATGVICQVHPIQTDNGGPFGQLGQAMSQNHSYFTVISLDGTANGYDLVKYHWDDATHTGAWTELIRTGDVCPLVPHSKWTLFNYNNTRCTSNDGLTITGEIMDDGTGLSGVDDTNNVLIAYMSPSGQLRLVMREGAFLADFGSQANFPGISLETTQFVVDEIGTIAGGQPQGNANGQMILEETISGPGIVSAGANGGTPYFNDRCLFAWDPNDGLMLVGRTGTNDATPTGTINTPLIFNTLPGAPVGFDIQATSTGEGTSISLTDNGWFTFRARDNFGNYSIYRGRFGGNCGSADFNGDGAVATDADIEAFFACLAGNCCATCGSPDFDGDGAVATDADIEAFFRVLAGGSC
jgi:hypothetical protein